MKLNEAISNQLVSESTKVGDGLNRLMGEQGICLPMAALPISRKIGVTL